VKQAERKKDYNRSLERALQILDAFTYDRQVLTSVQLSEILGLPRATVLRLCSTLVNYGYLKQEGEARRYSLGMRVFEQGTVVFYSLSIRKTASPHLVQLQEKLAKTVFLAVLDNDELVYIDKREDPRSIIGFTSKIGARRPPHWGMCGPVLMAYLPDEEVDRLLQKTPLKAYTKRSLTKNEDFKAWLRRIKEDGTVIDEETSFEGITGVAAPIWDFNDRVVASVGAASMSSSLSMEELRYMLKEVLKSAHAISADLEHKEHIEE
jgi:DNA-binding IclR family transcriptional regulator